MGVKSTQTISRENAENRYVELYKKINQPDRLIRAQAVALTDAELERVLEKMNDQAHDGEGYEDYIIDEHAYKP